MISPRSSCTFGPLLLAATIAGSPVSAYAAERSADFSIVATEVTTKDGKAAEQGAIADALRAASDEEAHYYDAGRAPVVMRIQIKKLSYKSAGKAIAGSLPFVGLVAGSNRNALQGDVELVDRASGKSIEKFKIQADDDTFFSAGDTALSLGKAGLSFLPFGMLVSGAVDVAQGATNNRAASQSMLTRGFVMLSYRKAYGDKAYKAFAAQRKAASAAKKATVTFGNTAVPAAASLAPNASEDAIAAAAK